MSAPLSTQAGWSKRRWVLTVACLFLVQGAVAWKLTDRTPLAVRDGGHQLAARLVSGESSPQLEALLRLSDPTLFALPGREGFSGAAWLGVTPWEHRTPGWSSAPEWLALQSGELLADLERFGATNLPQRAAVSDRLSRAREDRVALPAEFRPPAGTRFTITGEVSVADLAAAAAFPEFEHAGLLAPTVVTLLIDQQGRVFQAAVAAGGTSGSPAADRLALELARKLIFKIDPRISPSTNARDFERLRRARIAVEWWTRPPPPPTNAPAVAAPPVTS